MDEHGGRRLKEHFEIENPRGARDVSSHGRASWAEYSPRSVKGGITTDLINIRGCVCFWSAVVAVLALLLTFTFYESKDVSRGDDPEEDEFFREDHGFDVAAFSIADQLGFALKQCPGSEYCTTNLGLYRRIYQLAEQAGEPPLDLKIVAEDSDIAGIVAMNLPMKPELHYARKMEVFHSKDEGVFSGVVADRLPGARPLSDYGMVVERPTSERAIEVAADLVIALNTMHSKVRNHAILHCSLLPKNVLIRETEPYWQATLMNFNQAVVKQLKSGEKIEDPIFDKFSEFKHCRGTDWDHFFEGKKPYSANVDWRQLGLLLYRLVEAGDEHLLYDVFYKHLFVEKDDTCNYECAAKKALAKAHRMKGPFKDFVEWLIFDHDSIKDEKEVLSHSVFDSLKKDRTPLARAQLINLQEPTELFATTFATSKAQSYHPVSIDKLTEYPLHPPGYSYYYPEKTILNLELFLDFTSPWCKQLFDTIAHHVAPAYRQKVNFIFHGAPQGHRPQSGYVHEIAQAVYDVAGPFRFWEFADAVFMIQDDLTDKATYEKTRDEIHDTLLHVAGSIGIDNLMDLRRRVEGPLKKRVAKEMELARKFVVERGVCLWTPVIALNGIWAYQAGSAWEPEDWRQYLDFQVALVESPETAGLNVQTRRPYKGYEGEGAFGRSRQPVKPLGIVKPGAPGKRPGQIKVELFFDFTSADSKQMFEIVEEKLGPMFDGKVTFTFHHAIENWKQVNTLVHEASMAVLAVAGPAEFWDFAKIAFKEQHRFEDDLLTNKTRHQIHQDLAVLAGPVADPFLVLEQLQVIGTGNCGNRVTDRILWAQQYACSRGVYKSPKVFLNGISVESASAEWELEDWKKVLDEATSALESLE